jgi:DNA repair exonuclease SbcCD ATPase subunit
LSYRIGRVRVKNFGPFEDSEVDFGQPGLTGIEGVISWQLGANSNGAGKSMLLKAVLWALWGDCPDLSSDEVVRIGSSGGTDVRVEVVGGPHPIAVNRFRKHPQKKNRVYLYVDGQDVTRGTDPETQLAIESVLGMNARTFRMGGPAFGLTDEARSFFLATDTDRKAILDRILGLGLYTEAEKLARARCRELAEVCAPLQQRIAASEAAIEATSSLLQTLRTSQDVPALEMAAKLARLKVKRLEEAVTNTQLRLARSRDELQTAQLADREREREHQESSRQWQRDRERRRSEISTKEREGAVARSRVDTIDRTLREIAALEGAECPTCKRPVDAGTTRVMRADLESEREGHALTYGAVGESVRELTAALDAVPPPDSFVPDVRIETVRVELRAHEEAYQAVLVEQRGARSESKAADEAFDRATAQVTRAEGELEQRRRELAEAQASYDTQAANLALLEFWAESFGNRGLKSYLMEAEIPKLSRLATSYAQRLCGPGATVMLRATTALKTKDAVREKLSIEATIPGCCVSYAAASKGQRRRLDLSLLFAFRALLSDRVQSPFDQFFADELFDGLDDSGTEAVIEFLREFAATCPVVLVTHNPFMRKAMDRVFTVRHVGEYHALVDTGVAPKKLAKKRVLA